MSKKEVDYPSDSDSETKYRYPREAANFVRQFQYRRPKIHQHASENMNQENSDANSSNSSTFHN